MSVIEPPPVLPGASGRAEADLDALLRGFFGSELPNPWPALALRPAPSPPRGRLLRSRLALAASVALLFAGTLGLVTTPRPGENPAAAGTGALDEAMDRRPGRPRPARVTRRETHRPTEPRRR
jgi:hypothetical protein